MSRPGSGVVMGRRRFLSLGALGAGALGLGAMGTIAGCSSTAASPTPTTDLDYIVPTDPEVAAAESARAWNGTTAAFALAAGFSTVDLGGRLVDTWTYGGACGGSGTSPEVR